MSYSAMMKEEIMSGSPEIDNEKIAEVYSVLRAKKAIFPDRMELNVENITLAKRMYKLIKEVTDLKVVVKVSISKKLGEHKVYSVVVPYQKGFGKYFEAFRKMENEDFLRNEYKLKGFIRGMFLAAGYVKDPDKDYSMEFLIDDKDVAVKFHKILTKMEKRATITTKGPKQLIYIKNSEDIMDMIVMMGAMKAFFEYEEVTMVKEIKNKTIRAMNWEVANETKTINTGQRQVEMIEFIEENIGLESLSGALKDVAYLRLSNPEASLNELAEMAGITKSGIRNRFNRLEKLYREASDSDNKK